MYFPYSFFSNNYYNVPQTFFTNSGLYLTILTTGESLYIGGTEILTFDNAYLFQWTLGTRVLYKGSIGLIQSTLYAATTGINLIPSNTLWASQVGGSYDFGSLLPLTLGNYYLGSPIGGELVAIPYEITIPPNNISDGFLIGKTSFQCITTSSSQYIIAKSSSSNIYISSTIQQYSGFGLNALSGKYYS